jgi:hypothetical protein
MTGSQKLASVFLLLYFALTVVCCKNNSVRNHQATYSSPGDTILYLESLENKKITVRIRLDYAHAEVIIELNQKQKLSLGSLGDINHGIRILDNKFIEVSYDMHIIPEGKSSRRILICCSRGMLFKSIDLISYDDGINFNGLIEKNKSYKLIVSGLLKIHTNPGINLDPDTTHLKFDLVDNIFYESYENLNGLYNVMSGGIFKESVKFNNNRFPAIGVYQQTRYIFFRHRWFLLDQLNHLSQVDD